MATCNKFKDTRASSILELLIQPQIELKVPIFQRNYSWDKEKVENLWSDVMENFKNQEDDPDDPDSAQYLLGPIVLVRSEKSNEFDVIDGQQRLATLTMLFCAARDIIFWCDARGIKIPSGTEKNLDMIENTDGGKNKSWKLTLNKIDKECFEEIQNYKGDMSTKLDYIKKLDIKTPSEKLLRDNYVFLYNKILNSLQDNFTTNEEPDHIKKSSDPKKILSELQTNHIAKLNEFLAYIRGYNFIIKIMVEDNNTAFQIFETLNGRGMELSKSNLIKNHIINQMDKKIQEEWSNKWDRIFGEIIGAEQRDDEFIMDSLRSRPPHNEKYKISIKNLYKIIHDERKTSDDCKQYIKHLREDADYLSTLNDPDTYHDEDTKDDVYVIKILNGKAIRVPLLAAYRKWKTNDDYRTLVKLLVKFFFKFRTIRKNHPGEVEKIMLDITKMIEENKTLDEIKEKIKEKDDHKDFKNNFEKFMESPGQKVSKYILQQITLHLSSQKDDVRPIDNLTLEHILPKNIEKWEDKELEFLEDVKSDAKMEDYILRLGNLTLLKDAINAGIKNSTFKEKMKEGYKKSQLKINKKTVCKYSEWTAKIIDEREKKFLGYADKIWNLDSFYK